jgi:hypothetical protein
MPNPEGYIYDWRETERFVSELESPIFATAAAPLQGSGAGRDALLYPLVQKVAGVPLKIRRQTIGDCVSQGWATAIDIVMAVDILKGDWEEWRGFTASEPIYGMGRVEIGRGQIRDSNDGCVGAWAARAVTKIGTLLMQKYGHVDLSVYDGKRARRWGKRRNGVPDSLEAKAKHHPIGKVSLITSYEDARDAIYNLCPIPVASKSGFSSRRDDQGFARQNKKWNHLMVFIGMDDNPRRPGLLCQNSWGRWNTGPKGKYDIPDGSFWVDAEDADKMLRRQPDSFSVAGIDGYEPTEIDYYLG